ncbi:hypothetical protein B1B04_09175 [Lysinibacillus sp. KCTC 33748]|uniref:discoidin domain-containing protein n=1 Tax=unclassified Lysinibacillus TaxID=2636778 RepID=UPI0009A67271|nr:MULTISPECIES: discoidin domain-containing protein [unclassified Lysinibacillus]OXS74288.1 hypothetical protein B1B04_09175 [Lysinibacillus sp. KCTC 33748]SKB63689.1 F5/8 type C domain-containing protein [Lysinibacillus sp. AC-3]
MAVREITFKCTKAGAYYTIGGVRLYDNNGKIYPIKFSSKNSLTSNSFYIQGTDITGTVSTTNSYGTYYFVDSPFDTDKSIITNYPSVNYWLSSSADTIEISLDKSVKISRIDFIPYCGNGADRAQSAIEAIVKDESQNVILQEKYSTSTYSVNQVYSAFTPSLSNSKNMLFSSNNKTYSLKSIDPWYETKMTSDTAPSPLVASASSIWSSTFQAWKAFNGTNKDSSDCWATVGGTIKGWIQLDFGFPKNCNQIKLTSRFGDTANACPKDFTISASNDGVTFDVIANITGQTNWQLNETRIIQFRNSSKYRIYRLTVISNDGYSSYSAIGQLQFGNRNNIIIEFPKCSQENFIKYGQKELRPNEPIVIKSYILQDEVSRNDEGLYTTKLDRKPLSISFK